ncbi:hypothetical protein [Streptomyces mirabilis]|uniref:hypothetical protein n=1 Tax=Streptomyces mirabilis TaxID=68239 RepID=UPI0036A620FA
MAHRALVRGSIAVAASFTLVSGLAAIAAPAAEAASPTETVIPAALDYLPSDDVLNSDGPGGFLHQQSGSNPGAVWTAYQGGPDIPVTGTLAGHPGAGADVVATVDTTGIELHDMDAGTTTSIPIPAGQHYMGTYGSHVVTMVPGSSGQRFASLHILTSAGGQVTDTQMTGWPADATITGGTGAGDADTTVVHYTDTTGTRLALVDLNTGLITPISGTVPETNVSVLLTDKYIAWYSQQDTSAVHLVSRSSPGDPQTTVTMPAVAGMVATGFGIAGDWLITIHSPSSTSTPTYGLGGPLTATPLTGGDTLTLLPHATPDEIRTGPGGVLVVGGASVTDWAARRVTPGPDGTPTLTAVDSDPATPSPIDGLSLAGGTLFTVERSSTPSVNGFTRAITLGTTPSYGAHTTFGQTWAPSNCDAVASCRPIGTGDGRISQLWRSNGDKVTVQRGETGYFIEPSATGGTLVDADGRYVVYDGGSTDKQYIGDTDSANPGRVLFTRPVTGAALSGSTLWEAGPTAGTISQVDLTTQKTVQTVATGAPCVPSELQAAASRWVYWSCGNKAPAGVWDLTTGKDIPLPSAGPAQLGDGYLVAHDKAAGKLVLTDVHTDTAVTSDLADLPAGPLTDDRRMTWAVDKYHGGIAYLDPRENIHVVDPQIPASAPAPAAGTAMLSGQVLPPGHHLSSSSVTLVMQTDGNLVAYLKTGGSGTGQAIWSSRTSGHPGAYAIMQTDGNLVIYTSTSGPGKGGTLWSTKTYGNPGAHTALRDDGNLVVYRAGSTAPGGALWSSGSYARSQTIASGQNMKAGWWTQSRYTRLVMQNDGNLVMYRKRDGAAIWSSRTSGHPGAYAIMQTDGNLVIYTSTGGPGKGGTLWSTRTYGNPGAYAVMQDDGNLVVYKRTGGIGKGGALWASNTTHNVP